MSTTKKKTDINELLEEVLVRGASDLHITVGAPPVMRINGVLQRIEEYPRLTGNDTRDMIYSILTARQREQLEANLEYDLSYSVPGSARFRVNAYFQRNSLGAAFRIIPYRIKTVEELNMPPVIKELSQLPRGFILVTGPTGQGKSTTLAAIIDLINETRNEHIITVEDPIEFLHVHKRCIINQREVGADTHSFSNALKYVLRQDPDVILVGEMRDLETISTALTAAETGHLVFRHPAHPGRSPDRRPHHRRLPHLPAAAGQAAAGRHHPGHHHPAAAPHPGRQGAGAVGGDHDRHLGHPQHDPRGQVAPDLLGHAGRRAVPHADHGQLHRRPLQERHHLLRHRHGQVRQPRRDDQHDQLTGGCAVMSGIALEAREVDKSYRVGARRDRRPALNGLSFSLSEGKVMGLLGPNGAGKTTALKIIMDFLTPDSGEVDIFGKDWRDPAARGRVGFLPEQPYFHYYLTPRRVLRYLGKLLYMSNAEIETRVTHLLPQVGLGKEGDLALSRFSKGMLQRLGIAQALFNRPDLLVLDEPSTGLDPLGKMEVRKILSDAREQGATILLSSHQLSEVEEICDQLCIIDRGREVAQGSIPELLGREERYEVALERGVELTEQAAGQLAVERSDEGRTLSFPSGNLDEVLRLLAQQEARILSVRPRRITLEEFFLAHVESRSEVV